MNLYEYVSSNPVNLIDPDGTNPVVKIIVKVLTKIFPKAKPKPPANAAPKPPPVPPTRGLPPVGIKPPVPGQCKPGPASRPSEQAKGGQSLWDEKGGEWRWFPENKYHNPHWDYNPHTSPSSPWQNIPHGGLGGLLIKRIFWTRLWQVTVIFTRMIVSKQMLAENQSNNCLLVSNNCPQLFLFCFTMLWRA
jgi:hypothetical protein